jgi:hypothetical protein
VPGTLVSIAPLSTQALPCASIATVNGSNSHAARDHHLGLARVALGIDGHGVADVIGDPDIVALVDRDALRRAQATGGEASRSRQRPPARGEQRGSVAALMRGCCTGSDRPR